jgi:excisionase family DNA binding protein
MKETVTALSSRIDAIEQTLQQLITLFERDVGETVVTQPKAPLSLKQAAAYLHLSPSHLYSLIYSGAIQPLQRTKGSRILFNQSTLNNYLHDRQSINRTVAGSHAGTTGSLQTVSGRWAANG